MDQYIKQIVEYGDSLFGKRATLLSYWQEVAENFYPERGHFTVRNYLGEEFAGNLSSSYPLLARRDLGNALGSMLRPSAKQWFHPIAQRARVDLEGRRWLQEAARIQREIMYERSGQFVKTSKEGDHDFAAFGQCALSVELNRDRTGLLYRCWHLRDVAWCDDESGALEAVHRKWKPTAYQLSRLFPGKLSPKVTEKLAKDPYCEINCRHIVVPADQYQGEKKFRAKFVSLQVDIDNLEVMEVVGVKVMPYVIPRWQTVSGSQYSYSPATVCAMPDARLIQAVTYTLLEAGQKATNPPIIATDNVVRGDVSLLPGGITWVDEAYDERMGAALRPLMQDKNGLPFGLELREDVRRSITEAFYLNKLSLPPQGGPDMTAYEVGQRVQEFIRNTLPLFEPMEQNYNYALCDASFSLILNEGGFGPIPQSLSGSEVTFRFESPLSEAIEAHKAQVFMQAGPLLQQAMLIEPGAALVVNAADALRDALLGIGFPAKSLRSEEDVEAIQEMQTQKAEEQQRIADVAATAAAAKDMAAAQT